MRKPPGTEHATVGAGGSGGACGSSRADYRRRLCAASGSRPRPASRAGTPPPRKGEEPLVRGAVAVARPHRSRSAVAHLSAEGGGSRAGRGGGVAPGSGLRAHSDRRRRHLPA